MTQNGFQPRARREPQVLDGMRSPMNMDARLGLATSDGREHPSTQPLPEGVPDVSGLNPAHLRTPVAPALRKKWKFRSKNTNHRVQLITTLDTITAGGRVMKGKTIAAQFRMGLYETENPEHAEILFTNPNCGLGMDYWDAELEDHEAAKAQYSAFKNAVRKNPSAFVQLFKDISAGEFDDVMESGIEQEAREEVEAEMRGREVPPPHIHPLNIDPDGDGLAGETVEGEQGHGVVPDQVPYSPNARPGSQVPQGQPQAQPASLAAPAPLIPRPTGPLGGISQ